MPKDKTTMGAAVTNAVAIVLAVIVGGVIAGLTASRASQAEFRHNRDLADREASRSAVAVAQVLADELGERIYETIQCRTSPVALRVPHLHTTEWSRAEQKTLASRLPSKEWRDTVLYWRESNKLARRLSHKPVGKPLTIAGVNNVCDLRGHLVSIQKDLERVRLVG